MSCKETVSRDAYTVSSDHVGSDRVSCQEGHGRISNLGKILEEDNYFFISAALIFSLISNT